MELKHCPFCGGEADIWRMYGKYGYFMVVKCSVCGASGKTFMDGREDKDDGDPTLWETVAARRAAEAWNRRWNHAEPDT